MGAAELQALLRFLSQDAKLPLATAMSKVKDLQQADLDSADKLAKIKPDALHEIFPDEKVARQIVAAAKRVAKKRSATTDSQIGAPAPAQKKRRGESLFEVKAELSPAEIEKSLALPTSDLSNEELEKVVLFTNRAPLVLAFVVTLLKHTMPSQPLSSRLSLAQGYVSITSRSRAVSLGIETGASAEDEGFGEGQPSVTIMGKEIRVLRRFGYDWRSSTAVDDRKPAIDEDDESIEDPPLWALDLEALKRSNDHTDPTSSSTNSAGGMPIYTAQSARSYLFRAFDSFQDPESAQTKKKSTATAKSQEKEQNLGKLLRCLDILYSSWQSYFSPEELDKRTWGWYVKVRPSVENGVAGWGGKNQLRLTDILALCRQAPSEAVKAEQPDGT